MQLQFSLQLCLQKVKKKGKMYLKNKNIAYLAWHTLVVKVQFSCSAVSDSCSTPGLPVHHQLLELTQTHVHRVGDAIQPSHPLSSSSPSVFNLSSIRVFSSELALHIRRPKNWSFRFSISLFKEYSGLMSLRWNWLDLLAVQGTPKILLQHHSSKA